MKLRRLYRAMARAKRLHSHKQYRRAEHRLELAQKEARR